MKPIFRSAMFGFNKEDVALFIAQQSKQQEQKIREANEQNDALLKDCDALREELDRALAEQENLKSIFSLKKESIASLRNLSDEIGREKDHFAQAVQEELAMVEQLGNDMERLHDQLRVAESYREKAQKFDRLAGVLNEIVSGQSDATPCCEEPQAVECNSVFSPGAQLAIERIQKQKISAMRLLDCYEKILNLIAELDLEA